MSLLLYDAHVNVFRLHQPNILATALEIQPKDRRHRCGILNSNLSSPLNLNRKFNFVGVDFESNLPRQFGRMRINKQLANSQITSGYTSQVNARKLDRASAWYLVVDLLSRWDCDREIISWSEGNWRWRLQEFQNIWDVELGGRRVLANFREFWGWVHIDHFSLPHFSG